MTPPVYRAMSVAAAAATADAWTREVGRLLGRDDPSVAFNAVRAVLHALHRRLGPDAARQLSDALPSLLRGVFHEPLDTIGHADTREGFLACVDRATRQAVRPEEAVRSVCTVLSSQIAPHTWGAVRAGLPSDIAALLDVPPHPDYRTDPQLHADR